MLEGPDLVGKRVRVYWPDDKKWYPGKVKAFDSVTLEHLVRYDDGEQRQECLTGLEPLQWQLLLPAAAAASSTRAATMLRSAPREADPETLATRLAAAEGLTLVPANNEVGYRGVSLHTASGTFTRASARTARITNLATSRALPKPLLLMHDLSARRSQPKRRPNLLGRGGPARRTTETLASRGATCPSRPSFVRAPQRTRTAKPSVVLPPPSSRRRLRTATWRRCARRLRRHPGEGL
mmetsp:Transcript_45288/g.145936  ORF Transcript_45288/g.145936 Transcript_45288/m.145936 type:complete len:238 (+) Transcript_45288:122-835(+)